MWTRHIGEPQDLTGMDQSLGAIHRLAFTNFGEIVADIRSRGGNPSFVCNARRDSNTHLLVDRSRLMDRRRAVEPGDAAFRQDVVRAQLAYGRTP
jgi:hypothetical protein